MATKYEAFSFTPGTPTSTVLLNDGTLVPDFIYCQVSKNGSNVNGSEGFSDGTRHRARWSLDDTVKSSGRTTAACISAKKNSAGTAVDAVVGAPNATWNTTAGQFTMAFSTADTSYTVDGYVIGH